MNGIDELVNGFKSVFFCDLGQMSIPCGCCGAGMAEDGLDMAKA